MAKKVIDPAPIIKELADRCLEAKGLECSILGNVIDRLRAAPGVYNAPYWATEEAYKNGYEKGYSAGKRDAVHGQWVGVEFDTAFVCSNCGWIVGHELSNYCPNCGAKMDGDGNA